MILFRPVYPSTHSILFRIKHRKGLFCEIENVSIFLHTTFTRSFLSCKHLEKLTFTKQSGTFCCCISSRASLHKQSIRTFILSHVQWKTSRFGRCMGLQVTRHPKSVWLGTMIHILKINESSHQILPLHSAKFVR